MKNLTEINLEKSRSGVYQDTAENRRLHRVGQRYGEPKKEEISSESRKSDLEELKQDMLQAEKELKAHNKRRSLYASYTKGEENWSRTKAKLEQKLDTLQQEYKRRFAEVNKKPEEKKPNKVKIEGKTFRVEDGKIVASMFDNQSRIRKIMKFAAENGYKIAWEESKTVQKPEQQEKKETKKERIASGKKELSDTLNSIGLKTSEQSIVHNLRSDGADGLHYVSGGHVPFRASYYPSEDKLVVTYPNVRNEFEGSLKDQKFLDVIRGLIEDVKENNPVENVDKLSTEELKRNIQVTKAALRIHGLRKELFEKYQRKGGDDRWASIQGRIERKLDGLQKEYDKREQSAKKTDDTVKQSGESFTRVNLPDIPNAHKVNLKKYLSVKRKAAVDEAWNKAGFDNITKERAGVFQEGYNKLREQFNNNFDDMSKSERAELLYKILKMKNAMERK